MFSKRDSLTSMDKRFFPLKEGTVKVLEARQSYLNRPCTIICNHLSKSLLSFRLFVLTLTIIASLPPSSSLAASKLSTCKPSMLNRPFPISKTQLAIHPRYLVWHQYRSVPSSHAYVIHYASSIGNRRVKWEGNESSSKFDESSFKSQPRFLTYTHMNTFDIIVVVQEFLIG